MASSRILLPALLFLLCSHCGGAEARSARGGDPSSSNSAVKFDFSPFLIEYKSGVVKRLMGTDRIAAAADALTGVTSKDVTIDPSTGLAARVYLPSFRSATKVPILVYFHGGAFVVESAFGPAYHGYLNALAARAGVIAVSVNYRLAPEHPLPAAYDDCRAALAWVLSAADPWVAAHGDLARVFLAGDSAGGNACHHLAIQPDAARLRGAVLIHPWFWGSEAVGEETRHPLARAMGGRLWMFACPGSTGVDDPRMNPLAPGAPGLETLACEKVMVCTAEGDHLRWRGRAYAEAVTAARGGDGQGVELLETEGEGHVFHLFKPDCDKAKEMFDRIVAFVTAP